MDLPQSKTEIKYFFEKEKFIIQTCQQITKDLAGLINFTPDLDLDLDMDVFEELSDKVAKIMCEMPPSRLQQFIYRVDLKEGDFFAAIVKEDDCQTLAYLTVRRETQKVFLRAHFC